MDRIVLTEREASAVESARAAVAEIAPDWGGLRDDELVALARELEALGRSIDALRIAAAGEVDERSRVEFGDARLSARLGCRSAVELLERLTLASPMTIGARIRLARRTRGGAGALGADAPAQFAAVAAALAAGELGQDAGQVIVSALSAVSPRADAAAIDGAESALVAAALGAPDPETGEERIPCTLEELRIHARVWAMWLDQDGVEPAAERAERLRGFTVGRARDDGLTQVHGLLMPEVAGRLRRLIDAYLAPAVQFDPSDEPGHDPRTRPQRQHDLLAVVLDAAARAADAPTIGGAAPTLVITAGEDDLASGAGVADAGGATVPIAVAERQACTGAVQRVMIDARGRILQLGAPTRVFGPHQRRAIIARDGGCVIPGCTIPAGWCEIHHVTEHARGGPTHTDNGVLLCWWHHHHLESSGWAIRMAAGVPQVRAPSWLDASGAWRPAGARSRGAAPPG